MATVPIQLNGPWLASAQHAQRLEEEVRLVRAALNDRDERLLQAELALSDARAEIRGEQWRREVLARELRALEEAPPAALAPSEEWETNSDVLAVEIGRLELQLQARKKQLAVANARWREAESAREVAEAEATREVERLTKLHAASATQLRSLQRVMSARETRRSKQDDAARTSEQLRTERDRVMGLVHEGRRLMQELKNARTQSDATQLAPTTCKWAAKAAKTPSPSPTASLAAAAKENAELLQAILESKHDGRLPRAVHYRGAAARGATSRPQGD